MTDLRPCPFCGGKARITVSDVEFISYYAVACDNSDCKVKPFTYSFASKKEAIEAWNRRWSMIVKCHPTQPDKTDCPMIRYCLARLTDRTITGCGIPLYEAGLIKREDIQVEHTVTEVDNE